MSTVVSHRPDPDMLAAFIEGQLSPEEHRELELHLGTCEACREVVAESLALLEDPLFDDLGDIPEMPVAADVPEDEDDIEMETKPKKAKVLAHPGWQRAIALAPSLAIAALLMLVLWTSLSEIRRLPNSSELVAASSRLVAASTDAGIRDALLAADWMVQGWPTFRSNNYVRTLSDRQLAFRLGVRAVDLQVALRAGTEEERNRILNELVVLLRDGVIFAPQLHLRYEDLLDSGAADGAPPVADSMLTIAAEIESDLEEFLDSDDFVLGRWTEVGRLATIIADDVYFDKRVFRRPVQKLTRAELRPEVTAQIQQIVAISGEPVDSASRQKLREAFETIIKEAG